MSKKPGIETYFENGQWKNRPQGNRRASSVHGTKAEAQTAGRDMARARQTEHIVKNLDGRIGQSNSYGNDPHPPRG